MKGEIVLDEIQAVRSNRTDGFINFGQKPDGSNFRIPVIIIKGGKEGPTILVDGCTHGDEYEGTEALIQLAGELEGKTFAGTFIGVPAVNLDAFNTITRASTTDGFNLNRIYPGNKESYSTHRLAATYLERVVKFADYCITFHGGGDVLHLEPLVGFYPSNDDIGKKAFELAKVFNCKYLWNMGNIPFDGEAVKTFYNAYGTVTILPEVGSHCGRLHNREKNVKVCYDGIRNVMTHIGMDDYPVPEAVEQTEIELGYIHSEHGGIQKLCKRENEIVKAGETLAFTIDFFGNTVEELKAPYDGVVLGYWSVPVIRPGDWWSLYGKILN
jgi:Predicted deacylase